ncbi:MAG: SDR family oxidoreductase [Gemmatimonadota bacterium]
MEGEKRRDPQVEGKVVLVTGSTRGIGLAIAAALLEDGAQVMISSRDPTRVERVVQEFSSAHEGRVAGVAADVRKPADCEALVEATVDRFEGLDVLVNNAGVGAFATIQEMSPEDWDRQIRTNLDGVFHCSRAAVPHLISRGEGWILNIGSLAGRNTFSGGVAYNASKWGLLGMSEAMMLDLRHEGVRVSCIMPGSVNTHFSTGEPDPAADWKLQSEDVARVVRDLLAFPPRALPSRVELRPSRPPRKG